MPKYLIVGRNAKLGAGGKMHGYGDTIEIPVNVALEFRHDLEPVDAEGAFPVEFPGLELGGYQPHEQIEILENRREALKSELAAVDAQLKKLDTKKSPPETVKAEPKPDVKK